ncbi:MAG: SMI1/KNR4 family protein [Gemmataceae bacterium]
MSVAMIVARLRELADTLPRLGCDWEERPRFEPPATPHSIAELERSAGFVFPTELRESLAQTDSVVAMSVHNGYWLGGIKQLLNGDGLPRVVDGESAIPVATDGGGNAFLLASSGTIWRWDHETGKAKVVADSFGAFLSRIVEDWAAYVEERSGWRFLV